MPGRYRSLLSANPLAPLFAMLRWASFGTAPPALTHLLYASIVTAVVLLVGLASFRRLEQSFGDVILIP